LLICKDSKPTSAEVIRGRAWSAEASWPAFEPGSRWDGEKANPPPAVLLICGRIRRA